jgi:hypothetical protein
MPEMPPEIDTSKPHPARIYDYFIGGKNHFAADRETAAEVLRRSPAAHIAARENRAFLGRAVRFQPAEIIATLVDALPRGSYLVAPHLTTEHDPDATSAGQQTMREAGMTMQKRDSDVFAGLAFSGLQLVPPGVTLASEWRPAGVGPRPLPSEVNCYAGVARKP